MPDQVRQTVIEHGGKTQAAQTAEQGAIMAERRTILGRVGKELKENPPAILAKTRRKSGAKRAEAQRKAILLSKARKAGARIPKQ